MKTSKPLDHNHAKTYIQDLYQNISGFIGLTVEERDHHLAENVDPLYGEITFEGLAYILPLLNIEPTDIFYDLGSGVGKIPLQVFLTTKVARSIGIEAVHGRHNGAEYAFKQVQHDFPTLFIGRDLVAREGNIVHEDFKDATILFISCFDETLLQALSGKIEQCKQLKSLITLRALPNPLLLVDEIDIAYSFGNVKGYWYQA